VVAFFLIRSFGVQNITLSLKTWRFLPSILNYQAFIMGTPNLNLAFRDIPVQIAGKFIHVYQCINARPQYPIGIYTIYFSKLINNF